MKAKNMKKTLSLFLAVLMIALALPLTLLTVAAEEPVATTIAGVTSTSDGRTTSDVTYVLDWAWDGDLTTTYLGMDASKRYGVTNGAFGDGNTYQDYITVELSALSTLTSVTIWGGNNKTSQSFTNNQFDVYYSADGDTWTLHSEYSDVCGDGTNAGAGSSSFVEEEVVDESTYYGLKLDMNGAAAKYVRIAIEKGRLDRGWATLRDIDVVGTEGADTSTPPPSQPDENEQPAGPTQMGIGIQSVEMPWISFDALVGADADKELCAKKMFDGDVTTGCVWRNNGEYDLSPEEIANGKAKLEYVCSMVDGKMAEYDGTADSNDFYDAIIMDLSNDTDNKTYDVSVFRWYVSGDPNCISNSYSVYVSADGENWTLCQSFEEMATGYGQVYKYDKDTGLLYHNVEINQDDIRYVMLGINYARTTHGFLMYNVKELVVYEKGTEPKEEVKQPTTNDDTANNPKPNPKPEDTTASTTNAPETGAVAEEKGGCGSSIGMGALAVVALTGAAVTLTRKRKED